VGSLTTGDQAGIRSGNSAVPARDSRPTLAAHIRAHGSRLPWPCAPFTAARAVGAPDLARVNTANWHPASPWSEITRLDGEALAE
jgi:hypothetical protein